MKTAKLIKRVPLLGMPSGALTAIYALDPPMDCCNVSCREVMVSSSGHSEGKAFISMLDDDNKFEWLEVGEFPSTDDHAKALLEIGYVIIP